MKRHFYLFLILLFSVKYSIAQFRLTKVTTDTAQRYNQIKWMSFAPDGSFWASNWGADENIYASNNNGLSWAGSKIISSNPENVYLFGITPFSYTKAYAYNIYANSALFDTTFFEQINVNAGITQSNPKLLSMNFPDFAHFYNNNDGMILGDKFQILRTTDGGQNWNFDSTYFNDPVIGSFYFVSEPGEITYAGDTTWVVSIYSDAVSNNTVKRSVFRSINKGVTWTRIIMPLANVTGTGDPQKSTIGFKNGSTGILIRPDTLNRSYRILKTSDGGDNWTILANSGLGYIGNPFSIKVKYIKGLPDAVLFYNGKDLYLSQDGGASWQRSPTFTNANVYAYEEHNNTVYLGASGNRIYSWNYSADTFAVRNPYVINGINVDSNLIDITMNQVMDSLTVADTGNYTVQFRQVLHLRMPQSSELRDSTIWINMKLISAKRNSLSPNHISITTEQNLPDDSIRVFTRDMLDKNGFAVVLTDSLAKTQFKVNCGTTPSISQQPQSVVTSLGDSVRFKIVGTGTNIRYQWQHNGIDIPNATAASYYIASVSNADTGTYTVKLLGICSDVLSDTAHLRVVVLTGIRQSTSQLIKSIYPNPASDIINIFLQFRQSDDVQLKILDIKGMEMYSRKFTAPKGEYRENIDVFRFANGIYIIELRNKTEVITEKFIKE